MRVGFGVSANPTVQYSYMTTTFLLIVSGLYGLIFGSFLNVVAVRDRKRSTILTGRSQCPNCKRTLTWYELIPLVSFLIQGARCRGCKKPISWQYPLVELVCSSLTVFAVWYGYVAHGSVLLAAATIISLYLLLVACIMDATTLELPVDYVVAAGVIGGIGQYVSRNIPLRDLGIGVLVGAATIAGISFGWKALFKQEGMGEGDIWLAGALGALVGYPDIFIVIMAASMIGSVVGIVALGSKRVTMDSRLPFGPFLCLGALIALVWGGRLIGWYIL
jgi:leader peptidase (prepilin peptidase) / N-methyltransferase